MKIKLTNKMLIVCAAALVVVIGLVVIIWTASMPKGDVLVIHKGDREIQKIDLSEVEKPYTVDLGTNVLYVEKDGATMKSAKCPDKICVHTGKIVKNGEAIICAPNKIMVEFQGKDKEVDAVAGGR